MRNSDARKSALDARDCFELEPTSLFGYRSSGKVIVLGDENPSGHQSSLTTVRHVMSSGELCSSTLNACQML